MNIKVFQIYFNECQRPLLEPSYIPFYNDNCTVFFESEVIRNLVEQGQHLGCDYFGVVSHKLRQKIAITKTTWRNHKNIANRSINKFTPQQFNEILSKRKPDAMSYQCHMPHDPVEWADRFHPNFSKYFTEILRKIGYDYRPTKFADVFYCNYFVAKSELYERFVKEMLSPAMDVMQGMPELMNNSCYPDDLPENLKLKWGINHYPYHAFICERLFSYFAHLHKLKCLHY